LEDVADVGFDCSGREPEHLADSAVCEALGHEVENFAFTVGESVERVVLASDVDEGCHEFLVDDGFSGRDALDGVGEMLAVEHAVLEEIAGMAFAVLDQA
jgi:hypothetical protein